MISSGDLKEGDKLPSENELCNAMGVSRNTVRSALSKMNALGLVEASHGYGYFVRNINSGIYMNELIPSLVLNGQDLVSVVEFRIGVESQTAAVAAQNATQKDIQRLRFVCEKTFENLDDHDKFAKYDMDFHRAVAAASKNPLFIKTSEMLESMYSVWLVELLDNHGSEKSCIFHDKIRITIEDKNSEKASNLMKEHLQDVLNKVRKDNQCKGL